MRGVSQKVETKLPYTINQFSKTAAHVVGLASSYALLILFYFFCFWSDFLCFWAKNNGFKRLRFGGKGKKRP
uniref:SD04624p n=1 Tax=Drosophila melanogaster TaxID=7227 RepID=Q95SV8_DROME|nr:SD04624p [Drosophila melanogaster]